MKCISRSGDYLFTRRESNITNDERIEPEEQAALDMSRPPREIQSLKAVATACVDHLTVMIAISEGGDDYTGIGWIDQADRNSFVEKVDAFDVSTAATSCPECISGQDQHNVAVSGCIDGA